MQFPMYVQRYDACCSHCKYI